MAAGYDFSSPFMAAAIIRPNGQRVPLWSNNDAEGQIAQSPGVGSTTGLTSLPFLAEISVTLNLAYIPTIRAVLTPPYAEGIAFLDSDLIEFGQSQLEVQFGYVGGTGAQKGVLTPVFRGLMLKPGVTIGSDISITLNAQGVGSFSAARQEGSRQFNNLLRAEIIAALVEGPDTANPRDWVVDFSEVVAGSEEERLLFVDAVTVSQGHKTDYQLIHQMADEARCLVFQEADVLRVVPKSSRLLAEPSKVFALFNSSGTFGPSGQEGLSQGVFPIISLSSPTMAVYLPGAVRGLVVEGINSQDRQVNRQTVSDQEAAPERLNNGAAQPAVDRKFPGADVAGGNGVTQHFGSPDDPQVIDAAKAAYGNLTANMGVKLEVTSVGVPDLLPAEVVLVRGAGRRISEDENGRYLVHKVTHSSGLNGYETMWEGVSNTSSLVQGIRGVGNVNDNVPQANDLTPGTSSGRVGFPAAAAE